MKIMKHLMLIAFALALTGGAAAFAAADSDFAYADDGYTYTVKIYSGKEGCFDGDENSRVRTITGLSYGTEYTIDTEELGLTLVDPDRYYVRGIKLAGHDNDEVSSRIYQSGTFRATEDRSYTIAYGMAGGMVKYTVKYVSEDGSTLLEPREYYGMAGDKPVVSYKYVEGYLPNAYNEGKTLIEDEAQNVFTFTYKKVEKPVREVISEEGGSAAKGTSGADSSSKTGNSPAAGNSDNAAASEDSSGKDPGGENGEATGEGEDVNDDEDDDGSDGAGNSGSSSSGNGSSGNGVRIYGNANAGAGGEAEEEAGEAMKPQDYVDLDEDDASLTDETEQGGAQEMQQDENVLPPWIWAIVTAAVLALAAIILAAARRRKRGEEEDPEAAEESE